MIELKTLAKKLQDKLNGILSGFNFHIVTDTGELRLPEREGNDVRQFVNGLLTSNGSEVTNLVTGDKNNLIYATQSCTFRVILQLEDEEEDIYIKDLKGNIVDTIYGYKSKIASLRSTLNSAFQGVYNENIEENGRTYSVTTVYNLVESGQREMVEHLGDSFIFYTYIYYSFIENGVNTRDMTFKLDGATIPYQSITVFRTPIMDGNVYANGKNGSTRNISSQSTLSLSFELPAVKGKTLDAIINYILDGDLNQAHLLKATINGVERDYLVAYGENKLMGETIKNVGMSLSLVECPDEYELIHFNSSYSIYQAKEDYNDVILFVGDSQVYVFGEDGRFLKLMPLGAGEPDYITTASFKKGEILVSTCKMNSSFVGKFNVLQEGN